MFFQGRIWFVRLAILILCLFLTSCSSNVTSSVETKLDQEQVQKLQMLNETANNMYQLAKGGKYSEARQQLLRFTDHMTKLSYSGVTTADGLNALTSLVTEARGVYNHVKVVPEQSLLVAAKIRLAADALNHKQKPLWLEYRKVFKTDAAQLKEALHQRNDTEVVKALKTFHNHYLIIKPAVLISRDAVLVEKLDSWFIFMNGLVSQANINYETANEGASFTDALISELFRGGDAATTAPPIAEHTPFLWAAMMAGAIVSVLVYVGYKKYKFMNGM